jgi:hypothetical protein
LKVSMRTDMVFSSRIPMVFLLNSVSYSAAAAIKVCSGILERLAKRQFCSPVYLKNSNSWKVEVNSS